MLLVSSGRGRCRQTSSRAQDGPAENCLVHNAHRAGLVLCGPGADHLCGSQASQVIPTVLRFETLCPCLGGQAAEQVARAARGGQRRMCTWAPRALALKTLMAYFTDLSQDRPVGDPRRLIGGGAHAGAGRVQSPPAEEPGPAAQCLRNTLLTPNEPTIAFVAVLTCLVF